MFSTQDTPTTATDDEAQGIPKSVVVLREYDDVISEKHQYQVDRSNNTMPESPPEAIGLTRQTGIHGFGIGASGTYQQAKQGQEEKGGRFLFVDCFQVPKVVYSE